MKYEVCIIIVNYNGKEDTLECVESIKKCDLKSAKIIVVDNGSTIEKEKCCISDFHDIDVIESDCNLGFSAGNNLGIHYAMEKYDPDFYLLINNDTVVTPPFLTELINCYNEEVSKSEVGIITGKICYYSNKAVIWYAGGEYDREKCIVSHNGYAKTSIDHENEQKEITFATGCLWLIPRHTFKCVGYLDSSYFLYHEDVDFCCRVLDKGLRIIYTPNALIYHKVSASSGDNSPMQQYYMRRNGLYIIFKYTKSRKNRIKAYWRYLSCDIRSSIKKKCSSKAVFLGWLDFIYHKKGRTSINFTEKNI